MALKEVYQIAESASLSAITIQLNAILAMIADRLDRIEGHRGASTIQDSVTINSGGDTVHGFNTENEV